MFVYFIFRNTCKRTTRVSVDLEKCIPRVGTYAELTIDPALWYKVLALNSILVDCDRNLVWWTCEQYDDDDKKRSPDEDIDLEKVRDFFENKEQLSKDNVELCPTLAELYVIAQGVFQNLSPEVFDRDGNVSTYKDLIKLLHVYILPEIKFDHKHKTYVQNVIKQIEKEVENIEMLIKMNVQSKRNTEECLAKQRQYLLSDEGVSKILRDPSSDNDVIKLLIKHTEKDVRMLEDSLSILTDKITPLKTATDAESVRILSVTRAKRDRVSQEKEGIIRSREELVNEILERQSRPSKNQKSSTFKRRSRSVCDARISDRFHLYKRGTNELEQLSNDIKQHINTKIRLSSVREAVSLTLKEVESDGSSFGYNRKKGSLEVETDLFDTTKKPEDWKTLNEHVTMFLQTNQCEFGSKHLQFCTRIKENCKALKEQAREDFLIGRGSSLFGRLALTVGSVPLENAKSMRFSTRWLYGSVSKEDCEALCKQISEHITDMADEIAREIQGNNEILKSFHSQVYICYEEHVSTELMPVLSELYEQSFRLQAQKLSTWIKEYSATELDAINRTMKSLFPDTDDWEPNNDHVQRSAPRVTRSTSFFASVVGQNDKTSGSLAETLDRTWKSLLRRDRETVSDPTPQTGQSKLNTQFTTAFGDFFAIIRRVEGAASIFSKLRHLTNAVQSAQKTFSELVTKNGKTGDICADDILDILILLICRLDPQGLLKLYAHVNIIDHLSPYFLEGNINEYALISLKGAYQHLFERQEMHASDNIKQTTFLSDNKCIQATA